MTRRAVMVVSLGLLASGAALLGHDAYLTAKGALAGRLVVVLSGLKDQGLSVLVSESDSTHSEDLVDAVYIIERGRVEAGGDA